MKYLSYLLLVFCLTGHVMSIAEGEKETSETAKVSLEKSPRKTSTSAQQDKMNRRNFNVAGANAGNGDNNLLDDDDKRTFTYSYLNYGGYPYISLLRNTAYNVGFNSTQAGFVSLLGNAALALGGLFVLGKTKLLVGNPRPPVITYGRPSYGRPNRPKKLKNFKKKRGQFTFRKRKNSLRRPRPVRNHMSRHTPIIVNEPKNVLEPVRPLMLDDVAYDANYDDSNYDDAYFDIGNIDNNLAQRKGPYEYDQSNKRPSNVPEFDPNERRRPQIMIKPGSNKGRPPMQPVQEPYPFPPVVRRERPQQQQQQQQQQPYQQQPMSSMEEEMDAYFDNEDEFVSDRPTIVEKNIEKPKNYVDGSISLSPDGKRLRRKTRRQSTTTEAPTTPTASTTTTTTASTTQASPPTTTFVDMAPDFFAQNKPAQVGGFAPQKDEFDNYWSGPNDNSFMNDFGPPGFSRFRSREREAPEGVKRLQIEEKFPKQQQQQQQQPRVQRKKVQSGPVVDPSAPGSDPFGRDNKFDPFSDMAKEFDVDNDELIATISKAFDGFSDFKKIEDQK